MTGPGGIGRSGSWGDAYIDVRADTTRVEPDLERGLNRAGERAQPEAESIGEDLGGAIGDGVEREVGRRGPGIARSLGTAIEREAIDVTPNFRYDTRGPDGRFVARIREEIEEAFDTAAGGGGGGFFGTLRTGIADAIGAGFNISGRSPLIGLLVPVLGSVVGLVGALLQALNAVAAVLTTIPALVGAIGLQAGILVLAFKGVGTAIQGAFAATNATELKAALEGLTPAAQSFVKSLLPIRDIFKPIQQLAQENFFLGLGNSLTRIVDVLKPFLTKASIDLAFSLGYAFNYIAQAFTSPAWQHFLQRIIPATKDWLDKFGPSFAAFLVGLIRIADASIPFLKSLGEMLNGLFMSFGETFTDEGNLATYLDWLNSMKETLKALGPFLREAFEFLGVFLMQLDAAGGKRLIDTLTTILDRLGKFFASDIGFESLSAAIDIAVLSLYAVTFTVMGFLAVLALLHASLTWLWEVGIPGVGNALLALGRWIGGINQSIWNWLTSIDDNIRIWINNLIPSLYNAGKQIIASLIQGLRDSVPGLNATLRWITALIPANKGPESKDRKLLYGAGEAIMDGLGAGITAGAADVKKLLEGFTTGIGDIGLSNNNNPVNFGANAVQVNFNGALPSSDQAMATGQAVGTGINRALSARNTRLAVRSL